MQPPIRRVRAGDVGVQLFPFANRFGSFLLAPLNADGPADAATLRGPPPTEVRGRGVDDGESPSRDAASTTPGRSRWARPPAVGSPTPAVQAPARSPRASSTAMVSRAVARRQRCLRNRFRSAEPPLLWTLRAHVAKASRAIASPFGYRRKCVPSLVQDLAETAQSMKTPCRDRIGSPSSLLRSRRIHLAVERPMWPDLFPIFAAGPNLQKHRRPVAVWPLLAWRQRRPTHMQKPWLHCQPMLQHQMTQSASSNFWPQAVPLLPRGPERSRHSFSHTHEPWTNTPNTITITRVHPNAPLPAHSLGSAQIITDWRPFRPTPQSASRQSHYPVPGGSPTRVRVRSGRHWSVPSE